MHYADFAQYSFLGPEGGIDFGTCRVGDENIRQTLSLKNKGKYEIQYQFSFEQKVV